MGAGGPVDVLLAGPPASPHMDATCGLVRK